LASIILSDFRFIEAQPKAQFSIRGDVLTASQEELRFGFGRNWEDFIRKNLSEERVEISRRHMLDFLGLSDLKGQTFLDIGCGSGLHSLAAFRSGAASIFAFDYDVHSVSASRVCHAHAGQPASWTILQGSVLDEAFMESRVPKASIVYSWGVLHHTGDVWTAIRNAAGRVAPGGLFYLALYSADADVKPSPEYWLDVKRRYNQAGWFGQQLMAAWYIVRHMGLVSLWRRMRDPKGPRGMSVLIDTRDWLGGWPMEYVKDAEVARVCKDGGLEQVKLKTGEACHEYLFRRPA
jgi:SAM-dependent methyltransferase